MYILRNKSDRWTKTWKPYFWSASKHIRSQSDYSQILWSCNWTIMSSPPHVHFCLSPPEDPLCCHLSPRVHKLCTPVPPSDCRLRHLVFMLVTPCALSIYYAAFSSLVNSSLPTVWSSTFALWGTLKLTLTFVCSAPECQELLLGECVQ